MKLHLKFNGAFILAFSILLLLSCGTRAGAVGAGAGDQATTYSPPDSTKKVIVVDVRTPGEWQNDGHAACSVNYPLNEFSSHIAELKTYDKVVLVCRSGGRAGSALSMLQSAGYEHAENAGAWGNINCTK